jgi:hypothetical protein
MYGRFWVITEDIAAILKEPFSPFRTCILACSALAGMDDAVAILELAGATSTSLTGGGSSFGPNVAVEVRR